MSKRQHARRRQGRAASKRKSERLAQPSPIETLSALRFPPKSRREHLLVWAPAFIFLLLSLDYLWVTEDAFITFQSVENLWAGYGPNFNRGLRIESFSHPLWFLILCGLRTFGSEVLPMLAALAGVAFSITGLILATDAGLKRFVGSSHLIPLGAVMVAVLPPFWQFGSSGLETGLTFFWIGLSSWCLVQMTRDVGVWSRSTLAVLGLAPVIRPDLVVLALPLLGVALFQSKAYRLGAWAQVQSLAIFIIPGAIWQIFRMGYYGALLPNTYIAKEGFGSRWDQGALYLIDLVQPYWLIPVVAVGILLLYSSLANGGSGDSDSTVSRAVTYGAPSALIVGGILHAALVCRAGGDFMHGRLLLPALFALAAAFAVVPLPQSARIRATIIGAFSLWCAYVSLCARPVYGHRVSLDGIADERQWYVARSHSTRPVYLTDYRYHSFYRIGEGAAKLVREQGMKAVYWAHIGITVAMIPDDIVVIDSLGLNDHIGSRMEIRKRGRPGHEKIVPAAWFLARYPAKTGVVVKNQLDGEFSTREPQAKIDAAKSVLNTPALLELHDAVAAPMSIERFVSNIRRSWRLTFLRIPQDPSDALRRFGGGT